MKHDQIVADLESRLQDSSIPWETHTYIEHTTPDGRLGEIDLYAIYDGTVLLFEVKSTDRIKNEEKAFYQLTRAQENFPGMRCILFYAAGIGPRAYRIHKV